MRKKNRSTFELPSGKKEPIKLNNDNDIWRRLTEHCFRKDQFAVNRLIDWQDTDVWAFHQRYALLPQSPL